MWYKYIAGRFFGLVTKHACDGQTDRITTPKTPLAQLRRVVETLKTHSSYHTVTAEPPFIPKSIDSMHQTRPEKRV